MTKVMLLDEHREDATPLALALDVAGYAVRVTKTAEELLALLETPQSDIEIVIVRSSLSRPEDWNLLDHLCRLSGSDTPAPAILYVAPAYRGPRIRLEVERRGARLVYERSI